MADELNDGMLIPPNPLNAVLEQAIQVNPDQQGKSMKLSRDSGLHVDIVNTDPAAIERELRIQGVDRYGLHRSPATEKYLYDITKASLSHDDIENLSGFERALTPIAAAAQAALSLEEGAFRIPRFLEDAAALTAQGYEEMGVPRAINPIRALETLARGARYATDPYARKFREARTTLPEIATPFARVGEVNTAGDEAMSSALKGDFKPLMNVLTDPEAVLSYSANAVPSLLVALASGGSLPAIMAMEGSGELVEQADFIAKNGAIPLEKRVLATTQTAVISGMLEKVGVDYLRKFPAFSKFFKEADDSGVNVADVFKAATAEMSTEVLQQFNQNLAQKLTYDPSQQLSSGMLQSAIGGAGAGGGMASVGYVSGLQYKKAEAAAFDVKNNVNANEQNTIDKMNQYASQSLTRTRDKETFREFVQSIDKESRVYIDGEQAQKYMQERTAEEVAADPALQLLQKKLDESKVLGTDIAIPVADFATDIAGSAHFDALREHMKINPEGTTPAQQAKTEADAQDYVQTLMTEAKGNASQYAEAQDIFASVRDQLIDTGRVTPRQAGVMADIVPAWATVQAKTRGIPVAQVYQESGLTIEGPMTGKMDALSAEALKQSAFNTLEELQGDLVNPESGGVETSMYEGKNGIHLGKIAVDDDKQKQGYGTAAMQKIIDYADSKGQRITLTPSTDFGGSSVARLKKFYKQFGFVENKGKNKDFTISESMYRDPVKGQVFAQTPIASGMTHIEVDGVRRSVLNSNGKPIHTTEEGVRNFWEWFGDSKVVDAEGRPLVVYHGTKADFEAFDLNKVGLNATALGPGFYFTDSEAVASGYGDKLVSVYLKSENPTLSAHKRTITKVQVSKIIEDMEKEDEYFLSNYGDIEYEGRRTVLNAALDDIYTTSENDAEVVGALVNVGGVDRDVVMRSIIMRTKKDGLIADASLASHAAKEGEKIYVAFDPTNIKSVENVGTFDPTNPDIYMQQARGYYDPSQSLIRLTDASDLSTFLHEFAHFMYDMEKKNPNSKFVEKIHQWFKRNAESVAQEANGYMGMEGQPIEQPFEGSETATTPLDAGQGVIDVDGAQRPTTNSKGQPIHWSQEGVRNFWRWFGESKVVDAEGRPLLVYHSTLKDRDSFTARGKFMGYTGVSGISVTDNEEMASRYLDRFGEYGWVDGKANQAFEKNVMPLYVRAEAPLHRDIPFKSSVSLGSPLPVDFKNPRELEGYDALIRNDAISRKGVVKHSDAKNAIRGREIVVFDPTQIKSAIGNRGTYDPNDPNILMQPPVEQTFYSQLSKQIEAAPDRVFSTGKATAAWLTSNTPKLGIKKDELYWSGITDWLNTQGKVSKADVLAYLNGNGVQVQEVMLGNDSPKLAEYKKRRDEITNLRDRGGQISSDEWRRRMSALQSELGFDKNGEPQDKTKFASYQLSGGENYRELLLTLPWRESHGTEGLGKIGEFERFIKPPSGYRGDAFSPIAGMQPDVDGFYFNGRSAQKEVMESSIAAYEKNGWTVEIRPARIVNDLEKPLFTSSHYDQPNILTHIRFNERTDAEGKRVLFLEEIQSDWGQRGKKDGFKTKDDISKWRVEREELPNGNKLVHVIDQDGIDRLTDGDSGQTDAAFIKKASTNNYGKGGQPSAPFITDTKSWTALALKRMIAYAVENNFDSVAWTTGEQQAARYDLSKQINEIEIFPDTNGTYDLELTMPDGGTQKLRNIPEADLEDNVGKDLALKIIESGNAWLAANKEYRDTLKLSGIPEAELDRLAAKRDAVQTTFSGLDLSVGGEGMKGYYDQIVPQVANDILKKMGSGKVDSIKLRTDGEVSAEFEIQDENGTVLDVANSMKAAESWVALNGGLKWAKGAHIVPRNQPTQPGFHITHEMRAKVQSEGLPLFQGGDINQQPGAITAADVVSYLDNKTSGDKTKDAAIERAVHEQFARGFETYLMEGTAPSVELHNVFRTFARWLTQVYKSVRGDLKVNLDAEMRDVFARMLATDEQIAAAEARARFAPMFTTAAMAGMTDEEYTEYKQKQEAVRDKATETLRDKLIAQLTRQTKAWWKEEKDDLIASEVERLKGEKVYRAIDALRNGNIKLDTAAVKEGYSEVRTDKLGRKMTHVNSALTGMVAAGGNGIHPDQAAALLGYGSGDEMIQAIIAAPKIRQLAEETAQQQMLDKHGDILTDGTIEREADEAFQNEERGKLILDELKALSKDTKRGALDRLMLKQLAEDNIGKLSFREIQPGKYRAAEVRAAQESAAMLAEGNKEGAATAKARQALNYYLGMAATAAKNDTVKIVDRMARYRKADVREAIQKAGNGYWEQLNKILGRFEFRKSATMKQVDEANESLRVWMKARIEEDGDALVLSAAVQDEGYAKHWKNLPYDELVSISESVKNIEHVARYSNKITRMQEEVDFQTLVQRWTNSIDAKASDKFISQRTDVADGRKWGRWAMAQMTKVPYLASWLDGGERAGISHDILIQPFTDAYDQEVRMWAETGRPVMDAIQNRSKEDIKYHNKKVFIPEIKDGRNDGNLYGHQIIAVALNTGNAGNLKKMLLGEGWANPDNDAEITFDNPKLQAVLKHMTKADWQLVQLIWNQMDTLYPQLAEVHRRTTGLTPPRVEAVPFTVKVNGETIKMQGGYYPVKYDPNRSFKAEVNEDKLNAQTESMFGTMGIQASVNASATNERTGYYAPIRLSLDVVPNHLQETIHFITHHDAVRETNKLLRNARVAEVIKAKLGPEEFAQLKPWLNDIAKDGREAPMKTYWGSILQRLRFGMTLGVMGFKVSTGLMQFLGLSNTIAEVGSANMYQAVRSILGSTDDMKNAWEFALANSKVMNHRAETMDREIKNAMQKIEGKRGLLAATQEASMKHIALIQTYMVDLPSWHAAYIKGMKQWGDEKRAYQYADWVVENIQGSGVTKDMSAIMRNQTQEARMFTMFMTFFSSLWNIQRDMARGASTGYYSKSTVAAKAMFLFTIPVFLEMLLRGDWGDDDDDESVMQKYLTKLALYPAASVPFARDVASGIIGDYGYNISPVAQLMEQGTNSIPKLIAAPFTDDEITKSQVKGAVKFVGAAAGVPGVGQVWATGEHLNEVLSEGEDLTLKELLYGPNKEK